MKILHVLNTSTFSGAENVVCQIIKMFENDTNIEMAYTSPDGEIKNVLEERNIKFYPMPKLSYYELKRVIDKCRPDIIHGHDIRGALYASCFANRAMIVHTIHGNDIRMRKWSFKSWLYYISSKKAGHIFWVSESCFKQYYYSKRIMDKSSVLYNVINPNEVKRKINEDESTYNYDAIFLGRIAYPKNPQRLIRVVRLVVKEIPDFKLAIVGSGIQLEEIKSLAGEYGILNNIDFKGFMPNPYKVLCGSKVMIMTSDWEGTPMVALEAMALGIPIISTPTDGMNDVVKNGYNGFLSFDERELSHYIIQVVTDPDLREKMSKHQMAESDKMNDISQYKERIMEVYLRKG